MLVVCLSRPGTADGGARSPCKQLLAGGKVVCRMIKNVERERLREMGRWTRGDQEGASHTSTIKYSAADYVVNLRRIRDMWCRFSPSDRRPEMSPVACLCAVVDKLSCPVNDTHKCCFTAG